MYAEMHFEYHAFEHVLETLNIFLFCFALAVYFLCTKTCERSCCRGRFRKNLGFACFIWLSLFATFGLALSSKDKAEHVQR